MIKECESIGLFGQEGTDAHNWLVKITAKPVQCFWGRFVNPPVWETC